MDGRYAYASANVATTSAGEGIAAISAATVAAPSRNASSDSSRATAPLG